MNALREFYYDDVVFLMDDVNRTCSIGLVTKDKPCLPSFVKDLVAKNRDESETENQPNKSDPKVDVFSLVSDSEDDDSSSDGNPYDPPQTEMVNVSWFIHKYLDLMVDTYEDTYVETVSGNQLTLIDRNMSVSDIVKMNIDGEAKVGVVFNLKIFADVLVLGQNKVMRNVDCTRMKWIEPYMGKNLETNYSYEGWLGEVLDLTLDIIIRFADGAKLKVPDSALTQFDYQIEPFWNGDVILEGVIIEGEAIDLKTRKSKFLNETAKHNFKWLNKVKPDEIVQVVVEKIIPTQAAMQWVFGYGQKNVSVVPESPPQTLRGKELEKLEPVHPHPWHVVSIGDIWYYQIADNDKIIDYNPKDNIQNVLYKLMNGDLQDIERVVLSDNEVMEEFSSQRKLTESQVSGGGFVVKPRKKILCNAKSRSRRKSQSYKTTDDSQDDSDDENNNTIVDANSDELTKKNGDFKESTSQRVEDIESLRNDVSSKIKSNQTVAVGILSTKSYVDVAWQDGTRNYNIPTTRLIPQMYNIDEHDFFPGDFVVQKFENQQHSDGSEIKMVMHHFGTILKSNTKDRVATVQWFDYQQENTEHHLNYCSLTKIGEPQEIGVYDIAGLNEHHFVLGQEVIVKEEVAHKKYPAGYVTRLEPDNGILVIRWPDGSEMPLSPTDLLLTVESALGGASESSDDGDFDYNDDLSTDLSSNSDSSDWETVEEVDGTPEDEQYKEKLETARNDLLELVEKIKKVQAVIANVSDFTKVVQANLPPHMSQMLNVKNLFTNDDDDDNNIRTDEVSISEQQHATRMLNEIRHNIGSIYKQCHDVAIKKMYNSYRPRDMLSFRNIKNFVVSNMKFNSEVINSKIDETDNGRSLNGEIIKGRTPNGVSDEGKSVKDEDIRKILANYLMGQFKNVQVNMEHLKESINMWLLERSCFLTSIDSRKSVDDKASEDANIEEVVPRAKLVNSDSLTEDLKQIRVEDHHNELVFCPLQPPLNNDYQAVLTEELKPLVMHADSSDKTISNCEPIPDEQRGQFLMIESAQNAHKFFSSPPPSLSNSKFNKAWKRDIKFLSTSLPRGVIVKSFDDRVDLFSLMIVGPSGTPYQHALFLFDIQLGVQYPTLPPSVHYISLASERVNPNLYTEGKVCLSLLGTWNGKGTENWDSKVSSLLQLIVSLQGLILVSEPYFNEAGFEIRKGSSEGTENSQKYNENVINNISQSMLTLLQRPTPVFAKEIRDHFKEHGESLVKIHQYWASLDENRLQAETVTLPDFPLAPVSKGFQLSMTRHTENLRRILEQKLVEWQNVSDNDV